MQQNCRKKRTAKRLSVANVTGLLLACFLCLDPHLTLMFSGLCKKNLKFGVKLFQTKLLSRLSHNVCCLLSPPVLLRKFTSDFNQRLTTATAEITSKKAVRLRKQKKFTWIHVSFSYTWIHFIWDVSATVAVVVQCSSTLFTSLRCGGHQAFSMRLFRRFSVTLYKADISVKWTSRVGSLSY